MSAVAPAAPAGAGANAKPLRELMPQTAAFIDALRDAFGSAMIDDIIKRGTRGEGVFYAEENGMFIGTRIECEDAFVFDRTSYNRHRDDDEKN